MKKTILFVALLTSLSIQAQNSTTWNISVGGSFPMGDFASFSYDPNTLVTNCGLMDEDANGGGASAGFNLGFEALLPMQNDNLSFCLSADLNYNGFNSDGKRFLNLSASYFDNTLRNQVQSSGGTSVSSSWVVNGTPSYINIPLLVGMRYTMPMKNSMDFFAEGGIGMNLRIVTPIKFTERMNYLYGGYYQEITIDERFKFAMKGTLAFRLGLGVKFAEKLSLGAYYYYMGTGDVFVTITAKDPNNSSIQPSEQSAQYGTINPMMAIVKLCYYL